MLFLKRDDLLFSRFYNTSTKADLDIEFNKIVDKVNEIIEFCNNLSNNHFVFPREYNDLPAFFNENGEIIGRKLNKNDFTTLTVSRLTPGVIKEEHLSTNCVNGLAIKEGAITNKHLTDGCITSSNIADGVIYPYHLAPDFRITKEHFADNSIPGTKFQQDSITEDKIYWDSFINAPQLPVYSDIFVLNIRDKLSTYETVKTYFQLEKSAKEYMGIVELYVNASGEKNLDQVFQEYCEALTFIPKDENNNTLVKQGTQIEKGASFYSTSGDKGVYTACLKHFYIFTTKDFAKFEFVKGVALDERLKVEHSAIVKISKIMFYI